MRNRGEGETEKGLTQLEVVEGRSSRGPLSRPVALGRCGQAVFSPTFSGSCIASAVVILTRSPSIWSYLSFFRISGRSIASTVLISARTGVITEGTKGRPISI